MPSPEISNLTDYAVLWEAAALDDYGEPTVYYPIEIRVRWEESYTESADSQNTTQSISTTIFVDRELAIGSILWHGRLLELPSPVTGLILSSVTSYNTVPDIKGRVLQRTATLTRLSESLPLVVVD